MVKSTMMKMDIKLLEKEKNNIRSMKTDIKSSLMNKQNSTKNIMRMGTK